MTDDDLIHQLRERSANPRLATSASSGPGNRWIHAERFAPAPLNVVREAQQRFGFPLPTLLVRLWSEVANGGVGPGYGIYGLEGGLTDEGLDLPLPDLYFEQRDRVGRRRVSVTVFSNLRLGLLHRLGARLHVARRKHDSHYG